MRISWLITLTYMTTEHEAYVSKLTPQLQKIALEELREDDNIRAQSIEQFRDYISKHQSIRNCRTDSTFILRFLRSKKFNMKDSCDLLERYLIARQNYADWYSNLTLDDPAMLDIINAGYIIPMLERDEQGHQVVLIRPSVFDREKYLTHHMARIFNLFFEVHLADELNQVAGYTFIVDDSGASIKNIASLNLADVKKMVKCLQSATPIRVHSIIFINVAGFRFTVMEFVKSMMSDKIRSRFEVEKDDALLKTNKININILPKEYGGVVPMQEMIQKLKETVEAKRSHILSLEKMEILITKPTNDYDSSTGTSSYGSFRKLEVD